MNLKFSPGHCGPWGSVSYPKVATTLLAGFTLSWGLCWQTTLPVMAQSPAAAPVTVCQGTVADLKPGTVLTSATICQTGLTSPSLWWAWEQIQQDLGLGKKLISQWVAQVRSPQQPGEVKLFVNPQVWSLMNYFERYEFVNTFGFNAQRFGYNLHIVDTRAVDLASYNCQFQGTGDSLAANDCKIVLRSGAGIRARRNNGLQPFAQ